MPGVLAGFWPTGYPSPTKEITLTLILRTKLLTTATTTTHAATLTDPPPRRHYPTHEELADTVGSYAEEQATVAAYFQTFNIKVRATIRLLGTVTLAGSITDFERALHTQVAAFQDGFQELFWQRLPPASCRHRCARWCSSRSRMPVARKKMARKLWTAAAVV